jgi:hypothetical protein
MAKHVPSIDFNVMRVQILMADNYGIRIVADSLGKQRNTVGEGEDHEQGDYCADGDLLPG